MSEASARDQDLIRRAAAGDRAAFRALVERHRALVFRLAYQFCGNHHDADDITQEVCLKVYKALADFRHDAQFTSWLYRVVTNACIDHRRRHSNALSQATVAERETEDGIDLLDRQPSERPGPEQTAYAGELGQLLQTAIDDLPPGQRAVFVMRHYEEMKLGEIAEALGLAEGTVKRQLHAAVHRLRRVLSGSQLLAGERN